MMPLIQPETFDVATWLEDELFFNYPEGARSKRAFFPSTEVTWRHILHNRRHLYKRSDKRFVDQFWGEVVAYHVGCLLGVPVPPTYAAFDSRSERNCGALSQWFYEDGLTSYVPGGNWLQQLIPDFDRRKGEKHNFRSIQVIGRIFGRNLDPKMDWVQWWADAFLFDALIGNTDRHQDNWGYLVPRSDGGVATMMLAPLFDNGTSLGYELPIERFNEWSADRFNSYVMRGRHHMRWNIEDKKGCKHFEMLSKLISRFPLVKENLCNKIDAFKIDDLHPCLVRLQKLNIPIPLSDGRLNLYLKLISLRHKKIKEHLE